MKNIDEQIAKAEEQIRQLNNKKSGSYQNKSKPNERNGQSGLLSEGRFWKA